MKRVYQSSDPLELQRVRRILKDAGIDSVIYNESVSTLFGASPALPITPEIRVKPEDELAALRVIDHDIYENPERDPRDRPNALCPFCGYRLQGLPERRCPECGQRF